MVRMDFGRLHCYYRQPEITRAQCAYLAIYLVLIGNVATGEAPTERLQLIVSYIIDVQVFLVSGPN
jgi:hypothetical protein